MLAIAFGLTGAFGAMAQGQRTQSARPPAQLQAEDAASPAKASSEKPAGASHASVEVTGFRSARFGMSEAEVRSAIGKDFKISGDAVQAGENSAERTRVLTIQASDVLPGGGKANVSYIFGYQSKKLIQVAMAWSKGSDAAIGPDQLVANGNVLKGYFQSAGYKPDTIVANAMVDGGVLLFRGEDSAGHTTLLMLQGTMANAENSQKVLTPVALVLFYLADAQRPDVFKLDPGQF